MQEKSSTVYVLSIDLGSGGPKAAVIADTGEVMGSGAERVEIQLLPNGGAEQDAREWWNGAMRAAKKAIRESGVPPEKIVAVSCDSQYFVIVPVDEHGEPLMNGISWMDTRGGKYNREIIKGFPSVQGYDLFKIIKWLRIAGIPLTNTGIDATGHILYIKNERPDIFKKTYKFLEPMDYLTFRLTGKCTGTQHTMVTVPAIDNRIWGNLKYHSGLLKTLGLDEDREKFPDLVENGSVIGTLQQSVADELGLSPSTKVIAGMNDTSALAIGGGAVQDGDPLMYIGTTVCMTAHVPFKKTDVVHMLATLPSPFTSKHLFFGEQGLGGRVLEFFLHNIIYCDDYLETGSLPDDVFDRVNEIAKEVPAGSGNVLFLPWLNGLIVPEENPHARGAFFNLSVNTSRGHLARSLMEGIAYNGRWTLKPAEKFIGRKFDHLRFAGGGALSDLWSQILADVLRVSIYQIAEPTHTAARGSALFAFYKLGYRTLEELPDLVRIKKVYEPDDANRPVYDKMFGQFRDLYRGSKKVFASLNG